MQGTEPWRKVSLPEGTASVKALRPDGVWCVRNSREASVVGCNGLGERMEGEFRGGGPTVWGLGSRAGLWRAKSR